MKQYFNLKTQENQKLWTILTIVFGCALITKYLESIVKSEWGIPIILCAFPLTMQILGWALRPKGKFIKAFYIKVGEFKDQEMLVEMNNDNCKGDCCKIVTTDIAKAKQFHSYGDAVRFANEYMFRHNFIQIVEKTTYLYD